MLSAQGKGKARRYMERAVGLLSKLQVCEIAESNQMITEAQRGQVWV